MIGAGVYTTSGFSLAELESRSLVVLAWVAGGAIALTGTIPYAVLIGHLRESGGEYLLLSRLLHPAAGFIAGWISLAAGFTGAIAFAASAAGHYASPAIGPENSMASPEILATILILAGVLLHAIRVQVGASFQNALVFLKLLVLVIFVGVGAWALLMHEPSYATPERAPSSPTPTIAAFATVVMWISLSYSGFNAAIYIADEVRHPARTIPRAMMLATLLVALLYITLNALFAYSGPVDQLAGQSNIATIAASFLGGERLEIAMRWVIVLSLCTSVSSMLMIGPRVYSKMAQDGLFPRASLFDATPPRTAIVLQGLLAIAVVWISTLEGLLSYLGLTLALSTACTVAMVFRLPRGSVRAYHKIAALLYIFITLTFGSLMSWRRPVEFAIALLTIAAGVGGYWLSRFVGASATRRPDQHDRARPDPQQESRA